MRLLIAFAITIAGASEVLACEGDARGAAPPAPKPPTAEARSLHAQGLAAEKGGKNEEAIRLFVKAAVAGSGEAAMRLGDVYEKGQLEQPRDYSEALKWYNRARMLGALPPSTCR